MWVIPIKNEILTYQIEFSLLIAIKRLFKETGGVSGAQERATRRL